jgi:hypothetical protein
MHADASEKFVIDFDSQSCQQILGQLITRVLLLHPTGTPTFICTFYDSF